jgi:hypothetical protein
VRDAQVRAIARALCPSRDEPCPSCTATAEVVAGTLIAPEALTAEECERLAGGGDYWRDPANFVAELQAAGEEAP